MTTQVLVTGATGFLGNNVVRQLLKLGNYRVRSLVRSTSDPRPLSGITVEKVIGDVTDAASVQAACRGVDVIVHSAAKVSIGGTKLEQFRAANVDGTRNVCLAVRQSGAKLIHVSSVNALSVGGEDSVASEDTPLTGREVSCPYVISKCAANDEVRRAVDHGLRATIVYPGFMLGPFDWKPSSGRMLHAVAKRWARFAPRGGCSVCDVRDVTAAIARIVADDPPERSYILAGWNLRYLSLWQEIARCVGAPLPRCRVGPVAAWFAGCFGDCRERYLGQETLVNSRSIRLGNQFSYYDSSRAQRDLRYQNRGLAETIRDAWKWQLEFGGMETT